MSMNEVLREFLLETHENLALLDSDLVSLEQRPTDKQTLAQVFRTLHSVKGTAGFIGLPKLQSVAHSAESLLSRLRDGDIRFNQTIGTALLKVVDAIREMLASIENEGNEGGGDYSAVIAEVEHLRASGGVPSGSPTLPPTTPPPPTLAPPVPPPAIVPAPVAPSVSPAAESTTELPPLKPAVPTPPEPPRAVPSTTIDFQHPPTPAPPVPAAASPSTAEATTSSRTVSESGEPPRTAAVADTNIRVDVGLLDKMMTLVGELVLSRNRIMQFGAASEDTAFVGAVQQLNHLTTELQTSVMKTRMQPIGNVWSKFPRVVRDLAVACGKKVRFEMDGQETELDRTLLEAIRDPLTHMVRNAIDHGIEPPEVRRARGKPEEGRLHMTAFHEGGKVIVEIADDGGGIDVARVREKAVQNNLITTHDASRLSRSATLHLIFAPGFSTAEKVTQFSGRGVGMDVVRTSIEKIGGTVELDSREGQGTTIRMKIPLTLAIVPALTCVTAGERFAIPQSALVELVGLDAEQSERTVERVRGVPVYRLRGKLLPIVYLDEVLGRSRNGRADQGNGRSDGTIVVLQTDERQFGLIVDGVRDSEEIVVKPLQRQVKGIGAFAGATIMGDGRVALILDVAGIAKQGQLAAATTAAKGDSRELFAPVQSAPVSEAQSTLVFAPLGGGQMAVPLSQVARLEEIPRSALERVGGGTVVQYRGDILPLLDVSEELRRISSAGSTAKTTAQIDSLQGDEIVPFILYDDGEQKAGLMVKRIVDVTQESGVTTSPSTRRGVLSTTVLHDRVTEFLDLSAVVRSGLAAFHAEAPQ
jgi:two-component system chemotaxis sensor kinase CheA